MKIQLQTSVDIFVDLYIIFANAYISFIELIYEMFIEEYEEWKFIVYIIYMRFYITLFTTKISVLLFFGKNVSLRTNNQLIAGIVSSYEFNNIESLTRLYAAMPPILHYH